MNLTATEPHESGISGHLHYWSYVIDESNPFMQIHLDTMLLTLLIASSLVIFSMWLGRRVTDGVPVGAQNFMETIVGFVNTTVNDNFPVKNPFIAPLALTIFVFILMCNTLDVLPAFLLGNVAHMFGVEHFRPVPTNDLNLPAAMAVSVFLMVLYYEFKLKPVHFVKELMFEPFTNLVPAVLKPVVLPINLILKLVEELAKPLSLSFRLFGNMFAGEVIFLLISFLLLGSGTFIGAASGVLVGLAWSFFHLFIGLLQAFIFMILTVVYLSIAHQPVEH
ncbi:MAG: ATP synthase F0 subunit A [Zetaproteobacteria bacterium CG1_02_49_23]|nr:MAG: ATP synthase F0 subunit A [Zetaproteobacteria bacterium CG1_02_49_23]